MKTAKFQNKITTLSCSELARQTSIDKGCWSRWFNGEFHPSSGSLIKISKSLQLSVDEVLAGIEERRSESN